MPHLNTVSKTLVNGRFCMHHFLLALFMFSAFACSQEQTLQPEPVETEVTATTATVLSPASDAMEKDYASNSTSFYEQETANFYIVVADTGRSYDMLHEHMLAIHQIDGTKIDAMGRSYDPAKDLIALPEDDEDELYAGDYFPRRFPSKTLSLEYLRLYQRQAGEKTIALVAGIYDKQSSADSAAAAIQQMAPKAFAVKTEMFVGCLH